MDETFRPHEYLPQSFTPDRLLLEQFLARHGLRYEEDIEYACGMTDDSGTLFACGCCAGSILKCFAVDPSIRGQNLTGQIISQLSRNRFAKGYSRLFLFTRPGNAAMFMPSGFFPIASTDKVLLMGNSPSGVARYLRSLKTGPVPDSGAVVMNCNPLTRGHLALIEYAAQRCRLLRLFLVEEDRSVFPFADRLMLVQQGVAHLPNVRVHPSGPYMISQLTFPSYFLKEGDDAARIQAELDATVFAEKIALPLQITIRFVGEEPSCPATRQYNLALRAILPDHGVALEEIPRRCADNGEIISASRVRELLCRRDPDRSLLRYVPQATLDYLCSARARPVLESLRRACGANKGEAML